MMVKKSLTLIINRCRNGLRAIGAVCATALFRSHPRRWARVAVAGWPAWDRRNEIIAAHVPPCSSVLDIGAGAQTLRAHLHPSCRYQPCDLVQTSPEVILCDFNAGQYPALSDRYSHVICSGVLEYVRSPKDFLQRVSRYGNELLLSYNPLQEGGSIIKRMTNNWCNHSSRLELEALFSEVGLVGELLHESEIGELVYCLRAAKTEAHNE